MIQRPHQCVQSFPYIYNKKKNCTLYLYRSTVRGDLLSGLFISSYGKHRYDKKLAIKFIDHMEAQIMATPTCLPWCTGFRGALKVNSDEKKPLYGIFGRLLVDLWGHYWLQGCPSLWTTSVTSSPPHEAGVWCSHSWARDSQVWIEVIVQQPLPPTHRHFPSNQSLQTAQTLQHITTFTPILCHNIFLQPYKILWFVSLRVFHF